ncbi:hypothetical protein GF312_08715 [Candidatus Poribacteria bacterium]|nr:hypothetical protein [Candidatus Poribacteria bacterium]
MEARTLNFGLSGIVNFKQNGDAVECDINNIGRGYGEAIAITEDPAICKFGEIDLTIFSPTERTPIRCEGRITSFEENKRNLDKVKEYLAKIYITDISRIDERRLGLIVARKSALMG